MAFRHVRGTRHSGSVIPAPRTCHFQLGSAGFKVSGDTYAEVLNGDPAPLRGIGYLIPDTSGLRYLPATCGREIASNELSDDARTNAVGPDQPLLDDVRTCGGQRA